MLTICRISMVLTIHGEVWGDDREKKNDLKRLLSGGNQEKVAARHWVRSRVRGRTNGDT